MSSVIKKRLSALESKRFTTASAYTFQEFHKIPFTAEVQARFKALYEPQPERGQP